MVMNNMAGHAMEMASLDGEGLTKGLEGSELAGKKGGNVQSEVEERSL